MNEEKSQIHIDIDEKKIIIMTASNLTDLKTKIIKILGDLERYKCPKDWTNVIDNLKTNYIEVTL